MLTSPPEPIPRDMILMRFRQSRGHGRGGHLHSITYHLMSLILEQSRFDDIESLIAFVEDPDNLKSWLPSETDRTIFADGLEQGLREIQSELSH